MMGLSYSGAGAPAMCFNGHKNYALGWYADKQVTDNPATGGVWSGKLVGFVDYKKASTIRGEYIIVVVKLPYVEGDLYIQYNLAEDFNYQNQEHQNKVTITQATGISTKSSLLYDLSAEEKAIVGNYTIEVCKMVNVTSPYPSFMVLSIQLSTQSSSCPEATAAPSTSAPVITTYAPVSASPFVTSFPIDLAPPFLYTNIPTTAEPATFPPIPAVPVTNAPVTNADRKSTRLNSSHRNTSRMPSSA